MSQDIATTIKECILPHVMCTGIFTNRITGLLVRCVCVCHEGASADATINKLQCDEYIGGSVIASGHESITITSEKNNETDARRNKVWELLLKNMSEHQIAKLLGVSIKIIRRDVIYLKRSISGWLDGLAKDDFIYEYRLTLDKIKAHQYELRQLLIQTDDIGKKVQIYRALDENNKLYLEVLGETAAVYAYKQAISKARERQNVQTP